MFINLATNQNATLSICAMIKATGMDARVLPGLAGGDPVTVLVSSVEPITDKDIETLTGVSGFALAVHDKYYDHVNNKAFEVDNLSDLGRMVYIHTGNLATSH